MRNSSGRAAMYDVTCARSAPVATASMRRSASTDDDLDVESVRDRVRRDRSSRSRPDPGTKRCPHMAISMCGSSSGQSAVSRTIASPRSGAGRCRRRADTASSTSSTGPRTTAARRSVASAATASSSGSVVVATTISSHTPLSRAAATTHASTGRPPRSRSTLRGRRVEPVRAWITAIDATHCVSTSTTRSWSASRQRRDTAAATAGRRTRARSPGSRRRSGRCRRTAECL